MEAIPSNNKRKSNSGIPNTDETSRLWKHLAKLKSFTSDKSLLVGIKITEPV